MLLQINHFIFKQTAILLLVAAFHIMGQIPLTIKEPVGIDRKNAMIHNGIPLAKFSNITDITKLQITDDKGKNINAQFDVLSRWSGGLNSANPIQWLLVTFPAAVKNHGNAAYYLQAGSYQFSGESVSITENSSQITVNTGIIELKISKTAFNLFDEVSVLKPDKQTLISQKTGSASIHIPGKALLSALPPQNVKIERRGNLYTTIKVSGIFDNPPYGGKSWMYSARYTVFLNSPTIHIDFYFGFPGSVYNNNSFEAGANKNEYVLIDKVSFNVPISVGNQISGYISSEHGKSVTSLLNPGGKASLRQKLRPGMKSPPEYETEINSEKDSGSFVVRPMVTISGNKGAVGATIQKMKWYEPQSIIGEEANLEINIVSDSQWIGPYMGAFGKTAITFSPPAQNWDSISTVVVSDLDHALFTVPTRKYSAHTALFDELWDGTANILAQSYWDKMVTISQNTSTGFVQLGMYGFMTYGIYPRYWYKFNFHEFGANLDQWDGYFFGGVFSDYHNASSNITRQFAMDGNAELLNNLSFPAARRVLNTLIIQDDAQSKNFYSGWAPIGYGGYRSDFNSSHSYFENLYFYYYLTGDLRVLDVLMTAGNNLRASYSRDQANKLIPSDLPPANDWSGTGDRVASQKGSIFWFLGHASSDSSFLSDYRNQYDRLIDRHSAFLMQDEKEYIFTQQNAIGSSDTSLYTAQIWMTGLYTLENVWKLYLEYGDIKLGKKQIPISRYFKGMFYSCWKWFGNAIDGGTGDALVEAKWAKNLTVTWQGNSMGGVIKNTTYDSTGDYFLWLHGKSNLLAFMARAAVVNKDQELFNKFKELLEYTVPQVVSANAWNKSTSLEFIRLHPAIGYYAMGDQILESGDYSLLEYTKPLTFKNLNYSNQLIAIFNNFTHIYTFSLSSPAQSLPGEQLLIFNLKGKMVKSIPQAKNGSYLLDTSRMKNALYIAKLSVEGDTIATKFAIAK